ncbi:unnamed protein product [Nippostrongylus brasiliensis]|uniref:Delta-like protein n=1 Tax=Nippostrongylus brasiliensis TaxID=27835 RepID=A0A0N4Y0E2_NIPBR|nr:unnamed protein product [Nippostrongylus brasiliensis]
MLAKSFLTLALLQSTVYATSWSSGKFFTRVESKQPLRVDYRFRDHEGALLQTGRIFTTRTRDIYLPVKKLISENVVAELNISTDYGRLIQKLTEDFIIDGATPTQRMLIEEGVTLEFFTVCERTFYGAMCARKCVESRDARYICLSNGKKGCLLGWTGEDCNIAIQEPTEIPKTVSTSTIGATSSTRSVEFLDTEGPLESTTHASPSSAPVTTRKQTNFIVSASTKKPTPEIPDGVYTARKGSVVYPLLPTVFSSTVLSTTNDAHFPAELTTTEPVTTSETLKIVNLNSVAIAFSVALLILACGYALVKVFIVDVKSEKDHKICNSSVSRYSSSPRRSNAVHWADDDTSMIESHTYHEIDSFFVPPAAKNHFVTLV